MSVQLARVFEDETDNTTSPVFQLDGRYQTILSGTFNGANVTFRIDGHILTNEDGEEVGVRTEAFNGIVEVKGAFTAQTASVGGSTSLSLTMKRVNY